MKYKYELSKLVKQDLEDIWKYTFENWSLNQADKYYDLIITEFVTICRHPEIGRSIEDVKRTHRIRQIQSHLIVYKVQKEQIWIDRILHKRMDIESKLNE